MGSWLLPEVETRETRLFARVRLDPARFSRLFETRSEGGGFHVWCKTGARQATHSQRASSVSRGRGV